MNTSTNDIQTFINNRAFEKLMENLRKCNAVLDSMIADSTKARDDLQSMLMEQAANDGAITEDATPISCECGEHGNFCTCFRQYK